jgi:hypothetical protein
LDELLASFGAPLEEEEAVDKTTAPDTKGQAQNGDKRGGEKKTSETD